MASLQLIPPFHRGSPAHLQSSVHILYLDNAFWNLQDYLRSEEREVNHHGRVRKLGDDQTEDNVLRNNWVGGNEQLQLDLISRKEDVQVFAFLISC